MIARLRQWTTDLRCAIAWGFAAALNMATVFTGHGDWFNLALAAVVGALAVHSYRRHVRDQEDRQATLGRGADIDWWRSHLESESVSERQAAVELLAYWGVPVTVDPLEEPTRGPRSPSGVSSSHRRRDAAGLDPAEVQRKAHQIVASGRDLKGVIRLRESHEKRSQPDSALWIAACKLLEEAAAEQAGYEQDMEEYALRNFSGSVCLARSEPVGPTPREQMLREMNRQARAVKAQARARAPRDTGRHFPMAESIQYRR